MPFFFYHREDLQDPLATYNPITLDVLEDRYPFLAWRQLFERLVPDTTPAKIILVTPDYFDKVATHLSVDPSLVKNYLLLSSVRDMAHLGNSAMNDILQPLNSKLTGRTATPPRLRTCIQRTNDALGEILGHYFVNRVFADHEATSQKVQDLLDTIHDLYADRLGTIAWLDDDNDHATRLKALEKIKKMVIKSMYNTISPDIRSSTSLNRYYGALGPVLHPEAQFENQLAVASWQAKRRWATLNQAVDKNQWFMEPQMVNAYFSPTFNQVRNCKKRVLAGFMLDFFFPF
jgi:predicted metalloendopeptidase